MLKCFGKSVLKGIAVGKIYLYRKKEFVLTPDFRFRVLHLILCQHKFLFVVQIYLAYRYPF